MFISLSQEAKCTSSGFFQCPAQGVILHETLGTQLHYSGLVGQRLAFGVLL